MKAEEERRYALAFAIPCGTPGLRFLCRESFDLGRSHFDYPLGFRSEEMDCIVFFDDVLVSWERCFCNEMMTATHMTIHTGHQGRPRTWPSANFSSGLPFATFDPTAPPLLASLGEMTCYLDTFFDRREGGIEVIGGMHKRVMPCNWKFPAENFGGDNYHTLWGHLSALRTGFVRMLSAQATSYCGIISPGNGHGIIAVGPKDVAYPPMPELIAYEEETRSEVETRLGSRLSLLQPVVGTVFPNFSLSLSAAHTFRAWHPRGPDKAAASSWVYVDKMAPPEVKEAYRLSSLRAFSPGAPSSRMIWTTGRSAHRPAEERSPGDTNWTARWGWGMSGSTKT